jgi:XTP/dITP diphosphohydrolase
MIPRLLVATRNPDKLREIQDKLRDLPLHVMSLADFPFVEDVVEDQPDLVGNAIKKATEVGLATGLPTLADDTGLEVAALNGAPGVLSARYSGPGATYASNCQKLLAELTGISDDRRRARFRTVMCLQAEEESHCVEGVLEGRIGHEPRGTNGFGYDPIFVLPDGRTLAELELSEKNQISHRAQALDKMARLLTGLYSIP